MRDFTCTLLLGRHVHQSGFLADDAQGRGWSGRGPGVLLSGHFSGAASSNH